MRKNILFGVAVLLLALFLGAGLAQWEQPAISWASTRQQQQQLVTNAPVTAAQEAIVGIMPTQDVLADLYDQVAPSVVNIQVTVDTPVSTLPESPIPGFPFELPGDQGTPQPQQGEGSGFIFDMDGHIVTNNHVLETAPTRALRAAVAGAARLGNRVGNRIYTRDPRPEYEMYPGSPRP